MSNKFYLNSAPPHLAARASHFVRARTMSHSLVTEFEEEFTTRVDAARRAVSEAVSYESDPGSIRAAPQLALRNANAAVQLKASSVCALPQRTWRLQMMRYVAGGRTGRACCRPPRTDGCARGCCWRSAHRHAVPCGPAAVRGAARHDGEGADFAPPAGWCASRVAPCERPQPSCIAGGIVRRVRGAAASGHDGHGARAQ